MSTRNSLAINERPPEWRGSWFLWYRNPWSTLVGAPRNSGCHSSQALAAKLARERIAPIAGCPTGGD
jgi:hypothetical protein